MIKYYVYLRRQPFIICSSKLAVSGNPVLVIIFLFMTWSIRPVLICVLSDAPWSFLMIAEAVVPEAIPFLSIPQFRIYASLIFSVAHPLQW